MLVEFNALRDQVIRQDKDLKVIGKNLYEQEDEIALKNTRLVAQQLLDIEREEKEFDMDGENEFPLAFTAKKGEKAEKPFGLSKLTLSDRLE